MLEGNTSREGFPSKPNIPLIKYFEIGLEVYTTA